MKYDVEAIRSDFPILGRTVYGKPLVYLDNAATSQTPRVVFDEINRMYTAEKANVHRGVHCMSQEATASVEAARERVRQYINASSVEEVIFTSGATGSLNLVASSYGELLREGDEIILSVMEHHSNIVPWQLLQQRRGIVIKVIPVDSRGCLDIGEYKALFTERTRLVSVCHASNVLGTVNPIAEMAEYAHSRGAVMCVDGAQAVPHEKVDVQALGVDFYAFSAHKMYGPCGVGVLFGRRELLDKMPPYQGGGEMISHVSFSGTTWADLPFKFEAGTPDFVDVAAFRKALDYIDSIGMDAIAAHERRLLEYCTEKMKAIPGIRIFGTTPGKCALISFLVGNAHHYDTGILLDRMGIAVRTGHHCAQPLMQVLGIEGTVRVAFGMYNTMEEVETFIAALSRVAAMLA